MYVQLTVIGQCQSLCRSWRARTEDRRGDLSEGSRPSSRDLKAGPAEYEAGLPTMQPEQLIHNEGFVRKETVRFMDQLNRQCNCNL